LCHRPKPAEHTGVNPQLHFPYARRERGYAARRGRVGASRTVNRTPPMICLSWTAQPMNRKQAIENLPPKARPHPPGDSRLPVRSAHTAQSLEERCSEPEPRNGERAGDGHGHGPRDGRVAPRPSPHKEHRTPTSGQCQGRMAKGMQEGTEGKQSQAPVPLDATATFPFA
jgi:hypothetical protein